MIVLSAAAIGCMAGWSAPPSYAQTSSSNPPITSAQTIMDALKKGGSTVTQNLPNVTNSLPTASPVNITPDRIATMAKQGLTSQATDLLSKTGVDIGSAGKIIGNIATNGTNIQTATDIIGALTKGNISAPIGEAVSSIADIGKNPAGMLSNPAVQNTFQNVPGLQSVISNPAVQNVMKGVTAAAPILSNPAIQNALKGLPATEAVKQATNILGIAGGQNMQGPLTALSQGNLAGAAKTAVQNAVAGAVANILPPEMSALLGGLQGISGMLGGLFGGGLSFSFGGGNNPSPGGGSPCNCHADIQQHHASIKSHMTNKRKEHEIWMVTEFFTNHVAKALALMAEQLTVAGMQQVQIIGSFFDAKHQLESQRLLQQLTAQAHKDYQPSEGLCTFGTSVRSLAASERATVLAHQAIAARGMQRQLRTGENLSGATKSGQRRSINQDRASRVKTFIERFCDRKDNGKLLDELCQNTDATAETRNRDIDYTRSVENKLTLDLDFYTAGHENPSDDEASIFALGANLYGHDVIPYIDANTLTGFAQGRPLSGELHLMDARALNAKRSVAHNSFAAITGMKASGTGEAQPYLYKMVAELGVPEADLEKLLGKNPSYFAQMEILTKKALQNPVFYTELYDKPVNVDRKGAVLQAVGLMQDRDIYKSLLRSEAILSVLLDTMLQKEQDAVASRIGTLNKQASGAATGKADGSDLPATPGKVGPQ